MTANPREFGQYFRERREALDLNLSEFCRLNGFDKGNVSRLERGVSKPPKSLDSLQQYADALRLERESEDWKTFMRAAIAPIGPEAEISRKLISRLHDSWVKARDLEQWSSTREAQSKLPLLIRQLIHASTAQLTRRDLPDGEGQRHGWDGLVESTDGSLYVPAGVSAWEISVEKNAKGKAEEDFRNRKKGPLGLPASEVTFVFVTSRKWDKKQAWRDEKRELSMWKSVEVYDSADLEAWLEIAAGVDAWLGEQLGKCPAGVISIVDYWTSLSRLSSPQLASDVFLASRENTAKVLHRFLLGPPGILPFECRSPAEAIDFVAAYLAWRNPTENSEAARENEERCRMRIKTVLVKDRDQWASLSRCSGPLNLVVVPSLSLSVEDQDIALTHGHHVVIAATQFANHRIQPMVLPRPSRYDLQCALEKSGFKHERANEDARAAGGSLSVLKRRLSNVPDPELPRWCNDSKLSEFLPMLLVGAWDDRNEIDRNVLSRLSGRPYVDVQASAQRLALVEDAPLTRFESRWILVSPEDSWSLVRKHVTDELLKSFETIAKEILCHEDQTFSLSANDRFKLSIQNPQNRNASTNLQRAICETIAILGSGFGPAANLLNSKERAEEIVRNLVHDASWLRWATLGMHLPLLAEAAPDVFVEAITRDLRKKSRSEMAKLLSDDDGHPLMSRCRHAGLLCALECLAWSTDHFKRVCMRLADLAQIDTGTKWANRPANSLCEILLTWYPQTTASIDQRIEVLEAISKHVPDVAWKLLFAMLPKTHSNADLTQRPVWRTWLTDWQEGTTNEDYWKQTYASADLIVRLIGHDVSRWAKLLENLWSIPEAHRKCLVDLLRDFPLDKITDGERRGLSKHLRKAIQRHRDFADADRALPETLLQQMEQTLERIIPGELPEQHAWLFALRVDVEGYRGKPDERCREINQRRIEELTQVIEHDGFKGVLELANLAEAPGLIGEPLAKTKLIADDLILPSLLNGLNPNHRALAVNYAKARIHENWNWVNSIDLDKWNAKDAGMLLAQAGIDARAWQAARSINEDVYREYWTLVYPGAQGLDALQLEFACQQLIDVGRAASAIELLSSILYDKTDASPIFVMATLRANLDWRNSTTSPDFQEESLSTIQELFSWLQNRITFVADELTQQLAMLEWAYLGILDGFDAAPEALKYYLSEDPKFFAEVIALIFQSTNERERDCEASEIEKRRASHAYGLLMTWDRLPGRQPGGTIDDECLLKWIESARSICRQSGHLDVADSRIGEVMARQPEPEDMSRQWPCSEICDVIEDIQSDDLDDGFQIGIFNNRGVVTRWPMEGGDLERQEATKFRKWAEACEIDWPRVAAILRQVAGHYETDAKREDLLATERKTIRG